MIRALLIALALSACGAPQEKAKEAQKDPPRALPANVPATDNEGGPAPILSPPHNLPAYAPVYPGATIEQSYAANPNGDPGGHVVFRTDAAAEAVLDFYAEKLAALGGVSGGENGNRQFVGAVREDTGETAFASVEPAPEGGVRVTLAFMPRAQ